MFWLRDCQSLQQKEVFREKMRQILDVIARENVSDEESDIIREYRYSLQVSSEE